MGVQQPPCLAPEPLRRLNPSSHEPGGAQGLCRGQDTGRTATGRGREGQSCFAVWVGARDVPGAGKHTDKQLFLRWRSRHCPRNHQPEPLPFPGANFLHAAGRTLQDTPAPVPMACAPPESLRAPHSSGQNWAWSRSKIRFALLRTIPWIQDHPVSLAVLAWYRVGHGDVPLPLWHSQPPTAPEG